MKKLKKNKTKKSKKPVPKITHVYLYHPHFPHIRKKAFIIGTLGLGGFLAIVDPPLLIPWITPGIPPPGPFG